MDNSCRQAAAAAAGGTTMPALTVYFYLGISRLGTQANKVISLRWLRATDLGRTPGSDSASVSESHLPAASFHHPLHAQLTSVFDDVEVTEISFVEWV